MYKDLEGKCFCSTCASRLECFCSTYASRLGRAPVGGYYYCTTASLENDEEEKEFNCSTCDNYIRVKNGNYCSNKNCKAYKAMHPNRQQNTE